ncbi:STAS domain-containing protein [Nocardia fluminea]|uniref:Anti-sigma factor antagonist n=1 Tax=Nocardia fluminea TaxID=134984 RepID=A0A2N3WXF0_9NOCA|nr:STAS domain-containing protein [Nocardia fluminea]PKV98571.1 anti-anti-sigma factor [Nocardia fluminea]
MSTDFTVTCHLSAAGPVLTFAGELDSATAPAARAAIGTLELCAGQLVVVELSGLEFCDSSGITALLAARNRATDAGAGIALAAVPPNLARIFKLIGLMMVFTNYPTVAEAQHSWRVPEPGPQAATSLE